MKKFSSYNFGKISFTHSVTNRKKKKKRQIINARFYSMMGKSEAYRLKDKLVDLHQKNLSSIIIALLISLVDIDSPQCNIIF